MSNYCQVKTELVTYINARIPLIVINTDERNRVERMLSECCEDGDFNYFYYTETHQIFDSASGSNINVDSQAIDYCLNKAKSSYGINFVFGDIRRISDDNAYSKEMLNLVYIAKERNATVVVISSGEIWKKLANFAMFITLDYPDFNERLNTIINFTRTYGDKYKVVWGKSDLLAATTVMSGFSEMQIENILSSEIIATHGLTKDNIERFSFQKQKIFGKVDSIQYISIDEDIEISGMDNLKKWIKEKQKIFFLEDKILKKYRILPPKGILLVGVPGCGKSITAKLLGKEWKLPVMRFDIGALYNKWVGESERNMRNALQYIENTSPCILWIDEIEKCLSIAESGNDVGKRLLSELLFWMQESKKKVFIIATANSVDTLPYELYRKGRFSEVFYVGLPNEQERKENIEYLINDSLLDNISKKVIEELVNITENYSYSDIDAIIKDVLHKRITRNNHLDLEKELISSARRIIPISKINPDLVESIDKWGKERAICASTK